MKRRVMLASAGGFLATGIAARGAVDPSRVADVGGDAGYRSNGAGRYFSRGVATRAGYEFHRVRFLGRPLLEPGLHVMRAYIAQAGRPPSALAAVELRLPKPLSSAEGAAANAAYAVALANAGFVVPGTMRPEARTNMAPLADPPDALSIHAFTFAVPKEPGSAAVAPDYVVSGHPDISDAGELIAGHDYSSTGMPQKAAFILGWLTERITELGCDPARASSFHIYTRHAIESIMLDPLARSPLSRAGYTVVPGDPPGTAFELEFDVRSVSRELIM